MGKCSCVCVCPWKPSTGERSRDEVLLCRVAGTE